MQVQDLILADYATSNRGGKFTLVGAGFSKIYAGKFPCIHPLMFIMARLKVTDKDKGSNRIEIQIVSTDKKTKLFNAQANLDVKDTHIQDNPIALPVQINNLKIEKPDEYIIELFVNGQLSATHPLGIFKVEKK